MKEKLNLSALSDHELVNHVEGRQLTELEAEFLERMKYDVGLTSRYGKIESVRPPKKR